MKSKLVVKQLIISIVMSLCLPFSRSYAQDLVVPISIQGNNLYIMGKVNGVPIRFVLDTGAESLVVPLQYASTARLPAGERVTIRTAGGYTAPAISTIANEVAVGSKIIHNVPAIIMGGGDALLGQSVLKRFGSLTIDYQRRTITFNHKETSTQTSSVELSLLGLSGRYSSSLNPGKGAIQLLSVRVNPDRTIVGNVAFGTSNCSLYGLFAGHFYDSAIVISVPAVQDTPGCRAGAGARMGRIDVTLRLSESGWVGTYQSQFPDAGVIEMAR